MKSNTLYYTENYVQGRLIDEDGDITINDFNVVEFNPKKLVDLINGLVGGAMNKCMPIYRHAFIYEGVVYNLCLSCRHILIDSKRYYLKNKEIINKFVNKIIMEEYEREVDEVVKHFTGENWQKLLHFIPEDEISLFYDDFITTEVKNTSEQDYGVTNIVEQSQLNEMVNLFLSFSLAKKEEILNNLRNG